MDKLELLVNELCSLPNELQWLEFKHNNYDPRMIGQDISALANGAALCEKSCAYMIWGVDDNSHELVGTQYDLQSLKKGNQEIGNWLRSLLSPNAEFEFETVKMHKGTNTVSIGVLIIYRASSHPVTFEKTAYIRSGSYTKKLDDIPSLQAQLWDRLRSVKFEEQNAKTDLELTEALRFLGYTAYFDLLKLPMPSGIAEIGHYMTEEGILVRQDNGLYSISNMGAILFAKRLADFPRLARKAFRVVQYRGNNRLDLLKEDVGTNGYALGFEGLIKYMEALIPSHEQIIDALRVKETAYPIIAIREAVANSIIHQDFSFSGTGPLIELFDSRIEVTNAGNPIVDIRRIVDNPPRSRNEKLAALMRRMGICEELGTGWDKMITACEMSQLPAPKIELYESNTKVTLFSDIPFSNLSPEDKVWACYMHACIKQVQGEQLSNKSLRIRFGLKDSSSASISRLIKDTMETGLIKPLDPETAPRYMKYIPFWA